MLLPSGHAGKPPSQGNAVGFGVSLSPEGVVMVAPVAGRTLCVEKRFPGTNPTAGDGDTSLTLLAGDCPPGPPHCPAMQHLA